MDTTLALLFLSATQTFSLPPGLLSALCYVESHHKVSAVHHDDGNGDSLGVCQVKLNTAKMLGFRGTYSQLMKPETNIEYAAKYLRKQLLRYDENSPHAIAAYNSGSFRSGTKSFARNQIYVDRVFVAWAQRR